MTIFAHIIYIVIIFYLGFFAGGVMVLKRYGHLIYGKKGDE